MTKDEIKEFLIKIRQLRRKNRINIGFFKNFRFFKNDKNIKEIKRLNCFKAALCAHTFLFCE